MVKKIVLRFYEMLFGRWFTKSDKKTTKFIRRKPFLLIVSKEQPMMLVRLKGEEINCKGKSVILADRQLITPNMRRYFVSLVRKSPPKLISLSNIKMS